MRKWIGEYLNDISDSPLKILCFGDGLGFESLYFNLAGHEADYHEVSGPAQEFAKYIHELNGVDFRWYENAAEIPQKTYDVIICLDVLEHVPDPPAIIEQFDKFLKDDGRLIISAPFFLVNSQFPTHLDSNRKYSGNFHDLYGRLGYKMHEGCLFWNPIVAGKPNAKRRENSKAFWGKRAARAGRVILRGARYTTVPYTWGERLFKKGRKNPWVKQLQKIDPKSPANSSDRVESPAHID
jgi:SAM-dependent methyltransferase